MREPNFFLFRYAPVTTAFSIIDVNYDDVVSEWIEWTKSIQATLDWDVPVGQIDGHLEGKLWKLLPLDGRNRLLTETRDGRVAIFANSRFGDGSSDASVIARNHQAQLWQLVFVADSVSGNLNRIGSTQFNWDDYGTKTDHWVGHKFRSLAAHKESRWEWHEGGEPFPWEELETYKAKRKKERLIPEMVERYCHHFGIELFDPDYYAGRATIVRLIPPNRLANYDPHIVFPQAYPNQGLAQANA